MWSVLSDLSKGKIQLFQAIAKHGASFQESLKLYELLHTFRLEDERFEIKPIYTRHDKGYSSRSYSITSVWMDGNIGLCFSFKEKSAFNISFNFDGYNIYVKQLQSAKKSSAHLRLGSNWRDNLITKLMNHFSDFNLNIMAGHFVTQEVLKCYENIPNPKPNLETLKRVQRTYDSIHSDCTKTIKFNNQEYRIIK